MKFVFDDGGRKAAGFKGIAGDCVVRAIAIITERPYKDVYQDIFIMGDRTPRNGVGKDLTKDYLKSQGYKWVPTMIFGKGCTHHLTENELPSGRLIVSVSKHLTAVIDGVIHDTHDPSRDGKRCVYGYWIKDESL